MPVLFARLDALTPDSVQERRKGRLDAPNLLMLSSRTCRPTASNSSWRFSCVVLLTRCCRKSEHCWSLCARMRRTKPCVRRRSTSSSAAVAPDVKDEQ